MSPTESVPRAPYLYAEDGIQTEDTVSYLRVHKDIEKSDVPRMSALGELLGPEFSLVADVAMGETPTQKSGISWYGYVRLLIWTRDGDEMGESLKEDEITTCVVPCGSKLSATSHHIAYDKDMSPDKGAVCVYFPYNKLMVVCAHLHGTNKPLPESMFDLVRREQLCRIGLALDSLVKHVGVSNGSTDYGLLLCGDLNFRVESEFTGPEDKAKGGTDFSFVESRVSKGDVRELSEVFLEHDRLHLLLQGGSDTPDILRHCDDVVGDAVQAMSTYFPPTFTYKQDAKHPRVYANKRTPSWPDRILSRGLHKFFDCAEIAVTCRSVRQVVCSDHEAVVAIFDSR